MLMQRKVLKLELEALSILALLIIIFFSSFPWSLYGMDWGDDSQIFHFGNRIVNGDFPYVDFSYQTGFIGITFDAIFQKAFGETYLSSLIARFFVKTTTFLVLFITFRQFTSRAVSLAQCIGLALLYPSFGGVGGNSNWVILFLSTSILFTILGSQETDNRKSFLNFIIAGCFLALVLSARQSNGIVCIFLVLGVLLSYSLHRPLLYLRTLVIPYLIGILLGLGLEIAFLLYINGLSEAYQELFAAASEKKNISAVKGIIDALSGGAFGGMNSPSVKSVFRIMILPTLISSAIYWLVYRSENSKSKGHFYLNSGLIVIFIIVIFGIVGKRFLRGDIITLVNISSVFEMFTYDIPRIFFSLILIVGCLFPFKNQRLFGIVHPAFNILIALALGSTWAMQMSWPGRPYVNNKMLILLLITITFMSSKISNSWKRGISLAFLAVTASIFCSRLVSQPLRVTGNHYSLNHPMTHLMRVSEDKKNAFSMLTQNIKPGDSCFIHGSASILYTLLDCRNPTRLDLTWTDALTQYEVRSMLQILQEKPPQWLIDTGNGLPGKYITDLFDGSSSFYGVFNQSTAKELHLGLQKVIKNYKLVSTVKDFASKDQTLEKLGSDQDFTKLRLYQYSNLKADL